MRHPLVEHMKHHVFEGIRIERDLVTEKAPHVEHYASGDLQLRSVVGAIPEKVMKKNVVSFLSLFYMLL